MKFSQLTALVRCNLENSVNFCISLKRNAVYFILPEERPGCGEIKNSVPKGLVSNDKSREDKTGGDRRAKSEALKAKVGSERQNQGKGLERGMLEDRFLLSNSKNLLIIRLFKHEMSLMSQGLVRQQPSRGWTATPRRSAAGGFLHWAGNEHQDSVLL